MNNARRYQDLSAAQFQAVNASCERFEQSLLRNRPVSIECELDLAPPEIQNALFDELLAIELEWQFARDRAPELSNILQRFPDRQGSVTRLFDEISNTSSQRFAHSVAAVDLEQVGTIIGSYQLLEQIGSGGMGSVWRARQRKPVNREVALKLVKRGMDTQQVIARFEIERQALALMNHSNIANVFEAGSTKTGRPYFVMELVNGEKVTDYCDAHRLNTRARLMLFMSVCEAVQHAHQKGVIHRDLKPSNVLVTGSADKPIAKVIDFGLAKATGGSKLTEETLFTAVGQVVGTPTYMSPEQAQRANKDIDTRTDVYSLGVLLYETLIGETPFGSMESADTGYDNMLRRIREEDPPKMSVRVAAMGQTAQRLADRRNCSIKSLHSQLRGDLDVIVEKTLEKDRERRYQSTQEIADDIQRHLNRETIEARPASLLYRLRKSAGRNRTAFTFVALLLLSLATGTVLTALQAIRATRAERRLSEQLVIARRLTSEAENRTKLERWKRYVSTMNAVSNAMVSDNADLARRNLDAAPEEHRGWEWFHFDGRLQDASQGVLQLSDKDFSYCPVFAIHPDRWELAVHQPDGSFAVWNPNGAKLPRKQIEYPHGAAAIVYSRDGKCVAVAGDDHTIRVWDTKTGDLLGRLVGHENTVLRLAFHPDATRIASGGFDHVVRVWDIESEESIFVESLSSSCVGLTYSQDGSLLMISSSNEVKSVDSTGNGNVVSFEGTTGVAVSKLSPDGERLACGTGHPENDIVVWNTRTGQLVSRLRGHTNQVTALVFASDSSRIASASLDKTARLWDVRSGKQVNVFQGHTDHIYGLALCPDGTRLATGSKDATVRLWNGLNGQQLTVLHGHGAEVAQVEYSPDGSKIVSASFDGSLRVWDSNSTEKRVLRGHDLFVYDVAFHPSKNLAASVGWDGKLIEWDLSTGKPTKQMKHPADVVTSVSYSCTGNRLVTLSRQSNTGRIGRNLMVWDQPAGDLLLTVPLSGASRLESRTAVSRLPSSSSVGWSADKPELIAVGDDDGRIRLFDLSSGEETGVLRGHEKGILDLDFRPITAESSTIDYQLASASKDLTIRIWDISRRVELAKLDAHKADIHRVRFSPDGRLLASASSDKTVRLWDTDSFKLVGELLHGSTVYGIEFSPKAKRLATGCADGTIRLWDIERRQEVAQLLGHEEYVHAVAFSGKGTQIVSASGDGTLRVWDRPKQ